jgi:diadenosine tetraphosphate (Ap4A) HIT family hydrolase
MNLTRRLHLFNDGLNWSSRLMPAHQSVWSLHPQLDADAITLGDLPLSRVLLVKDASYPWLLLVPRRADACEIVDLDEADQTNLMREIAIASRALKTVTSCDKLNVAAIGNVVPQLHVHVIARRRADPAWPRPVWGAAPRINYDPGQLDPLVPALRGAIWPTSD